MVAASERVRKFRERQRQLGMVDIRTEIPLRLRDSLKMVADGKESSMKVEIREAIEDHVSRQLKCNK